MQLRACYYCSTCPPATCVWRAWLPGAMLRRAAASLSRRAAPPARAAYASLADGWAQAAPNLDPPNVATDFMTEMKAPEGTGIPAKLTLNFYLPHGVEFDAAEVRARACARDAWGAAASASARGGLRLGRVRLRARLRWLGRQVPTARTHTYACARGAGRKDALWRLVRCLPACRRARLSSRRVWRACCVRVVRLLGCPTGRAALLRCEAGHRAARTARNTRRTGVHTRCACTRRSVACPRRARPRAPSPQGRPVEGCGAGGRAARLAARKASCSAPARTRAGGDCLRRRKAIDRGNAARGTCAVLARRACRRGRYKQNTTPQVRTHPQKHSPSPA